MPEYIVQRPLLRHDGKEYGEGDTVDLSEKTALRLVGLGALEEAAEEGPEPSDDLVELVGTRPAGALANAGLPTIEEALSYEGDLTELDDVGDGTAETLADFAE